MITTNVGSSGAATFFVTSDDPAGPWSDPVAGAVAGIDPDLAWDDDGNCWVHFSGLGGIARCPHRPRDRRPARADPNRTWSGTGLQYPEAPHLYEREGRGTCSSPRAARTSGHCVSVARGPSPVGPWEGARPTRSSATAAPTAPIQNTGHGDLVEARRVLVDGPARRAPQGHRPRLPHAGPGDLPDAGAVGRRWPVPGDLVARDGDRTRPARARIAPIGREDFDGPTLAPHWVGVRAAPGRAELADGPSGLARRCTVARRRWTPRSRPSSAGASNTTTAGSRTCVEPGAATEAGLSVSWTRPRTTTSPSRATASSPEPASDRSTAVVGERRPSRRPRRPHRRDGAAPHGPDAVSLGFEDDDGGATHPGRARRPLPLHRGDGRVPRPHDRDVRRRRGRRLRLVRLRGGVTVDRSTRRAVMADVAAQAGVSVMTVSRVLNGFPGVADETRLRVEEAVAALGLPRQHRGAGARRRTVADARGHGRRDRAVRPLPHALRH